MGVNAGSRASDLSDLITPECVLPRLAVTSRRQALSTLSETLARGARLDPRVVFDAVLMRERLNGTGVGEGVAIPHALVKGVTHPIGAFARLESAQDFEALDKRPADLVFLLIAPLDRGGDHLKALARVSRFLRRADAREKLRGARGADELYALFAGALHSDAA